MARKHYGVAEHVSCGEGAVPQCHCLRVPKREPRDRIRPMDLPVIFLAIEPKTKADQDKHTGLPEP